MNSESKLRRCLSSATFVLALAACFAVLYAAGTAWGSCTESRTVLKALAAQFPSAFPLGLFISACLCGVLSIIGNGGDIYRQWPANLWFSPWSLTVLPALAVFGVDSALMAVKSPCELMIPLVAVYAVIACNLIVASVFAALIAYVIAARLRRLS